MLNINIFCLLVGQRRYRRESTFFCVTYLFLDITLFNPHNAELFLYKSWRSNVFFQFETIIHVLLSFSVSLEYLCYGSTAIINRPTLILSTQGSSYV